MSCVIFVPSTFIKILISILVVCVINYFDVTTFLSQKDIITRTKLFFSGQQILFGCFFYILSMHIPSFLFYRGVNLQHSLTILEHILHYYLTMASILFLFTYTLQVLEYGKRQNVEILIGAQMSFYFLWHIYNKIVDISRGSRTECTFSPALIKMTIFIIGAFILPFGLGMLWEHNDTKDFFSWIEISCKEKTLNLFLFDFLFVYSAFLISDIASIYFQWIEKFYPILIDINT